jgi:hypothetical protein
LGIVALGRIELNHQDTKDTKKAIDYEAADADRSTQMLKGLLPSVFIRVHLRFLFLGVLGVLVVQTSDR